jgi:hypothetical protein
MIRSPESQGLLADLKREQSSTLAKPALNEETFQRLLSAAYTLQQHNGRRLVTEPTQQAAAYRAAVLETATFKRPQSKPAQPLPLIQRAVSKATNIPRYRMGWRRISQSNELRNQGKPFPQLRSETQHSRRFEFGSPIRKSMSITPMHESPFSCLKQNLRAHARSECQGPA